jgi:integrase
MSARRIIGLGQPFAGDESLKDWFRVFRNMTNDAIVQLHLERDPTLRISFGDAEVAEAEAPEEEKLTVDECHLLLEAMRTKRAGSFALLTTKKYTGQRFCHVSALKWSDFDWSEMVIRFRRKQVLRMAGASASSATQSVSTTGYSRAAA